MEHSKQKSSSIDWGKYATAVRQWWPVIVTLATVLGGMVLGHLNAISRIESMEERMEKVERQASVDHDILVRLDANMEAVKVFMERMDRKLP